MSVWRNIMNKILTNPIKLKKSIMALEEIENILRDRMKDKCVKERIGQTFYISKKIRRQSIMYTYTYFFKFSGENFTFLKIKHTDTKICKID